MFAGCNNKFILIGFIGNLSSKTSQTSIDIRNALELTVKIINEEGGINGKKIKLTIKDNYGSNDSAIEAHNEFKEEGVQLVIGHQASRFAPSMLESQGPDLLFFSPTMGTDALRVKDDYILRCVRSNTLQGDVFHQLMIDESVHDIAIVYDLINEEYTAGLFERIKALNDEDYRYDIYEVAFDSRTDALDDVAKQVLEKDASSVLLVSQATISAELLQYIKSEAPDTRMFSVPWSMSRDFIHNSGTAGDGTIFIGSYTAQIPRSQKTDFLTRYENEYGYQPSSMTYHAYDAIMMLAQGIESANSTNPVDVRDAILSIEVFEGLEVDFSLDEYGDGNKPYMIYQQENGDFIRREN